MDAKTGRLPAGLSGCCRKESYKPEGGKERAETVWKRYTGLVERYKTEIAMGPLSLANRVVVRIRSEVSSGTYESAQPVRCLVETDLGDAYATGQLSRSWNLLPRIARQNVALGRNKQGEE